MLTRIEIDGFKSFHKFAVDLRPFQVFIGPNGVGKTNLFDAILLLSHLAGENTVEEAFRQSRGEPVELFTLFPDSKRASVMIFAVEMLIGRTITDSIGKTIEVSSTRLRYELELHSQIERGKERVYVMREELVGLKDADDRWAKEQISPRIRKDLLVREKRPAFISTVIEGEPAESIIFRNQDVAGSGREGTKVEKIDRTVLSTTNAARYPTIYAAKLEMMNWRFLQLNPFALRLPASAKSPTSLLPDGSNLAAVLHRMSGEKTSPLTAVTKDMAAMISGLRNLTIKPIPDRGELLIEVETADSSRFSSRVLSDGTLRLLALVALKNDPLHRGVLCFEEPENGVQPLRLKQIVDVLYDLATHVSQENFKSPLRQVLINTHSPGLLANVPANSMYYVGMRTHPTGRETYVVPVRAELIADEHERYYTWEQVQRQLSVEMDEDWPGRNRDRNAPGSPPKG